MDKDNTFDQSYLDLPEVPERVLNYCHDPEIIAFAKKLGITDASVINNALSIGEGTYDAQEAAMEYLKEYSEQMKQRNRQPRLGLSRRGKQLTLEKLGLTFDREEQVYVAIEV